MPIYEYEPLDPQKGCKDCRPRFEIMQGIYEKSLIECPFCGQKIRKLISCCRAAIIESNEGHKIVEKQIASHESEGKWSHAAELADKHAEAKKDRGIKIRAIENYRKAGYDSNILEKQLNENEK